MIILQRYRQTYTTEPANRNATGIYKMSDIFEHIKVDLDAQTDRSLMQSQHNSRKTK
jgi:hypothetical protein